MKSNPKLIKSIVAGLTIGGIVYQAKKIKEARVNCLDKCINLEVPEDLINITAQKTQKNKEVVKNTLYRYARRSCELRCKYKSLKEKKQLIISAKKELPEYVFKRKIAKIDLAMSLLKKKWISLVHKGNSIGTPALARAVKRVIKYI